MTTRGTERTSATSVADRPDTDGSRFAVDPSSGFAGETDPRHRRIVFGVSAVVLLATVALWLVRTVQSTGSLVYALDDAYIHLALADRLAFTGTWGVQAGTYQSASSAPAWNLLEAALLVVRIPAPIVPLLLGVVASLWALWTMSRIPVIERFGSVWAGVAVAVAVPFSLALVGLTLMGMAHTLQVAVVLAALAALADRVGDDAARRQTARWLLPILFLVGTSIRYEMLLVAAGCAVAYLVVQRPTDGGDLGPSITSRAVEIGGWVVAALVPVAVVAAVNLASGQYALPDSVIAKGRGATSDFTLLRPLSTLMVDRRLGALVILAAVVLVVALRRLRTPALAPLVAAFVVAVGFVAFGPVTLSWLGRYQAMAAAALIYAICLAAVRLPLDRVPALSLVLIAVLLPAVLQVGTYTSAIRGSEEIHLQHKQSVEFLNRWYPGGTVALNDAGVLGYEYAGETIDLVGLTSHDVLVARVEGRFGRDFVEELFTDRDVDLAVGYTAWIGSVLPENWTEVGRWCLDQPTAVVGDRCQSFFAAAGEQAEQLADHLEVFRPELDPGITLELPTPS